MTDHHLTTVENRNNGLAPRLPEVEISIGAILAAAVEKGMDPAGLEKITDLYIRLDARKAGQEFAAAMAAFQEECPPIKKTSNAKIATRAGGEFSYTYAELDEIATTVRPALHKHGLSYSWDSEQDAGKLTVTCTVKHANGHSSTSKFQCPVGTNAAISAPQNVAASLTYARRQSLISALGLTTCDRDADGAGPPEPKITEHQAANLEALMAEVRVAEPAKFFAYMGVERMADLPASRFQQAVRALEAKRKQVSTPS